MKLRKPLATAPSQDQKAELPLTHSLSVETITPIFSGGLEAGNPDPLMPVRASAIRGQLRFWWRLIHQNQYPSSADLFQEEKHLFGGMDGANGATASQFDLWISDPRDNVLGKPPREPKYALFPLMDKPDTKLLEPGLKFTLNIRFRNLKIDTESIWKDQLLPALRWWASFGGLGSRTRRGLGAIKIESLKPVSETEAAQQGCELKQNQSGPTAEKAWQAAIQKLSDFRQKPGLGRNQGQDQRVPGRSRWPEADSIRERVGRHLQTNDKSHAPEHPAIQSFPRAHFGLPIITQFKDKPWDNTAEHQKRRFDPEQTVLKPVLNGQTLERLASPLILKPMWTGSQYAPIALLLPHEHLNQMGLCLDNDTNTHNPHLPHTYPPGTWWPESHQTSMTHSPSDNPLKGKTGAVLHDFLLHFEGKH